jgi:uncharacterized membrane protein YccC
MRFVFLLGGLSGFAITGAASWYSDSGAGRIFFDAACGCLVGALLFRWFWTVLLGGLRETVHARHKAAQAAQAAQATEPKPNRS